MGYYNWVPALNDGSACADGTSIVNVGVNSFKGIHNGAPTKYIQTDDVFLDNKFFSADGVNQDAKSYDDIVNSTNYEFNKLYKCETINGIKHIKAGLVYAQDKMFTPTEYNRNDKWLGDCELDGGGLVPYPVTAGTGIGANQDMYPVEDGTKIYLVGDA